MPLTDSTVKNAKPKEKDYKLADGKGMFLFITRAGGKLWRLKYRFDGKEKLLAMGQYPEITLKDARTRRDDARKLLANNPPIDPNQAKRKAKEEQAAREAEIANTFARIAEEWYGTVKNRYRPTNQKKVLWLLRLLNEALGTMPIQSIRYKHIREFLCMVADKGNLVTAHKLGGKAREIFSYARRNDLIDSNPATDFTKDLPPVKSKQKHHAYITDETELATLLRAIDDYREVGHIQVYYALKILPYLALRNSELRGARWEEIDFDKTQWIIPAERQDKDLTGMKMRVPHTVPLPRQVLKLFQDLRQFTGDGPLCFPSPVAKKKQPISDMALRNALRRMGYSNEEITPHGFRHTFSTLTNELGFGQGDHIEASLAHKDTNSIRGTYNHAIYIESRREIMERWANYLDSLREGRIELVANSGCPQIQETL